MSFGILIKAPADVLDYDFDFSRWMPTGDRISHASADLAESSASVTDVEFSDTNARVWLSGGLPGDAGTLTLLITTIEGRTKEVTAQLRIREND